MDDPTAPEPPEGDDRCPHCGQAVADAWIACAWCGEQLAAPAELAVGAKLGDGRYQILGVIGRGGFGITYEAGDTRLKRRVAIKELFPDSAVRHGSMVLTPPHARAAFRGARERFIREARVLARFTHPGIVRVYEVFEEHGTAYLVMERLGGRTLVEILRARNQPFTEAEVLDVAGRVAAALRPVHAAGVLHRDLNPSNVMLTEHGRIVLIDFGLARDFDQDQTVGMTRVVTPGYAPLEQYRGEARFGPSTDVYGLAATCYRLATGKVPMPAVERDAGGQLRSPHTLNPAISKPVSDAMLDGLELEPGHRPQDLDTFLARLQIRRLPDTPRSVLLGSPGAEMDAPAPDARLVELTDPGPVAAQPEPVVVEPGPGVVESIVDRTELVGADHGMPGRFAARSPEQTEVDPDRTQLPEPGAVVGARVDPEATRPAASSTAPLPDATSSDASPVLLVDPVAASAVGLQRPGRRKITLPLAAVAVATGTAAPVLVVALLVLVVLPLLATWGDSVAHRLRSEQGIAGGWVERRLTPGWLAPARFVRNVGASVVRTSPVVGVAAVAIGGWYLLAQTSLGDGVLDLLLRVVGGATVVVVLLTSREGSSRFRVGLGIDELVRRAVPHGRTSERVVIGWIVAVIVVAAALWLAPDTFPLP